MTEELTLEKPAIDLAAVKAAIVDASGLFDLETALNKARAQLKAQDSGLRIEDLVDPCSLPVFSDVGPEDTSEVWSYNDRGSVLVTANDGSFVVKSEQGPFYIYDTELESYVENQNLGWDDGEADEAAEFDTVSEAETMIGDLASSDDAHVSRWSVRSDDGREWFTEIVYSEDGVIEDEDGDLFEYVPGVRRFDQAEIAS